MSLAEISVSAPTQSSLEQILHNIGQHGASRDSGYAATHAAPSDGVFPDGFYATTNLQTSLVVPGGRIDVDNIEMDCGILVDREAKRARCVAMHRVRAGDQIVIGDSGVRVTPLDREDPSDVFAFMGSGVSTERPKELVVAAAAQAMREAHACGKRVLFVGGPAILHTGAGRHLEMLIRAGWIDVLFAGNALATHDIEHAIYGTSLGVDTATGAAVAHGHEHHLKAINAVRRLGSISKAVTSGLISSGIMHAATIQAIEIVLAGSIRDDGPLPDVITDTVVAQDAMRAGIRNVAVALMVATTLHSIAVGNLLPAEVRTICVDSDPDTVIKLMDRGSHQSHGIVTDCEYFLKELAAQLLEVQ
jgi:lysine-ketoglutarate reductase/saccharopine dehydrogenase-like protein (TIGR00300 family)